MVREKEETKEEEWSEAQKLRMAAREANLYEKWKRKMEKKEKKMKEEIKSR